MASTPNPATSTTGAASAVFDRWSRWILILGYFALYTRTLAWGWLGMDDTKVLHHNPYIGPTWSGIKWALTDVQFGARWMPGMWLVANIVPNGSVFGYRLL